MIADELLAHAHCRRDQLLRENPALGHYQDEIDSMLLKTAPEESRLESIILTLHAKLMEINTTGLIPLKRILDGVDRLGKRSD